MLRYFFKFMAVGAVLLIADRSFGQSFTDTVTFAVLTDSHIGKPGNDIPLALIIDDINKNPNVDFVVHAGDVSDFGSLGQLQHAKRILDRLVKPYRVIPGNHDTYWSDNAGQAFSELWGDQKFMVDYRGIRFIGLSTGPYSRTATKGYIPKHQVAWLDDVLATTPREQPIILFCHIPLSDLYISNFEDILLKFNDHHLSMVFSGHGHQHKMITAGSGYFKSLMTATTQFRDSLTSYNQITVYRDSLVAKAIFPGAHQHDTIWTTQALMKNRDIKNALRDFSAAPSTSDPRVTWKYTDNANVFSAPAVYGNNILFGNMIGEFKSVNTRTSTVQWIFNARSAIYSSPVVAGEYVVFASADSSVYCLDISNGSKVWELKTGAPLLCSPVIENDLVLIGGSDHQFRAIDLASGKTKWSYCDLEGHVFMTPTVSNGKVIFGTWKNRLYALDIDDGSLQWYWQNPARGPYYSPAICNPVVMGDMVYIVNPEEKLRGFDLYTGALVAELDETGVWESLGGDTLNRRLMAKTVSGSVIVWKVSERVPRRLFDINTDSGTNDLSPSIPVFDGKNHGYIGSSSGKVFSVDIESGAVGWSIKLSEHAVGSLSLFTEDTLLVSSLDGEIALIQTHTDYE